MSDLPPEVDTVDLYVGDRFYCRMSRELFDEELDFARAFAPQLREAFSAALRWFEDEPPLALNAGTAAQPGGGISGGTTPRDGAGQRTTVARDALLCAAHLSADATSDTAINAHST